MALRLLPGRQSRMDKREADPEYGGAEDDDIANRTEDVDAPDAETEDDVKTDVSDDDEDLDDEVSKSEPPCLNVKAITEHIACKMVPQTPPRYQNLPNNHYCLFPHVLAGQPSGEPGKTRRCQS